jgi:6,7-dimethyl-8-ribityllumazine synthase
MSEPYDHARWDASSESGEVDLEEARENVFDGWPSSEDAFGPHRPTDEPRPEETGSGEPSSDEPRSDELRPVEPQPTEIHPPLAVDDDAVESELLVDAVAEEPQPATPEPELEAETPEPEPEPEPVALVASESVAAPEHAPGELAIPPGYGVLEGEPDGTRRAVAVVVARFNGDITSRLLASALTELERAGVAREGITVMPVPGAFELPIGAMALARTRRFACIVALGCVIRGDTPHFDYVASEAASGLQLAALETGVPVAFGVLTLEHADQAETRIEKGAEAVRTALEMADLFSHLRAAAAR